MIEGSKCAQSVKCDQKLWVKSRHPFQNCSKSQHIFGLHWWKNNRQRLLKYLNCLIWSHCCNNLLPFWTLIIKIWLWCESDVLILYLIFAKMGHSQSLFLYCCLFNAVDSKCSIKILPMTGLELQTSGNRSDRSTNWVTTTAPFIFKLWIPSEYICFVSASAQCDQILLFLKDLG